MLVDLLAKNDPYVAQRHYRNRVYTSMIHATTNIDHEKNNCMVFYFYTCKWFCSYSYGAMVLRCQGKISVKKLTD